MTDANTKIFDRLHSNRKLEVEVGERMETCIHGSLSTHHHKSDKWGLQLLCYSC